MAILAPELPTTIACIIAELIWKNAQYFTKAQRSGLLPSSVTITSPTSFYNFKNKLLEF